MLLIVGCMNYIGAGREGNWGDCRAEEQCEEHQKAYRQGSSNK